MNATDAQINALKIASDSAIDAVDAAGYCYTESESRASYAAKLAAPANYLALCDAADRARDSYVAACVAANSSDDAARA